MWQVMCNLLTSEGGFAPKVVKGISIFRAALRLLVQTEPLPYDYLSPMTLGFACALRGRQEVQDSPEPLGST